jgi:hypothetical protein
MTDTLSTLGLAVMLGYAALAVFAWSTRRSLNADPQSRHALLLWAFAGALVVMHVPFLRPALRFEATVEVPEVVAALVGQSSLVPDLAPTRANVSFPVLIALAWLALVAVSAAKLGFAWVQLLHLARGDHRWACFVALARLAFPLHPSARWLASEIALAREQAVDAVVAAPDSHAYASLLVDVAEAAASTVRSKSPAP